MAWQVLSRDRYPRPKNDVFASDRLLFLNLDGGRKEAEEEANAVVFGSLQLGPVVSCWPPAWEMKGHCQRAAGDIVWRSDAPIITSELGAAEVPTKGRGALLEERGDTLLVVRGGEEHVERLHDPPPEVLRALSVWMC